MNEIVIVVLSVQSNAQEENDVAGLLPTLYELKKAKPSTQVLCLSVPPTSTQSRQVVYFMFSFYLPFSSSPSRSSSSTLPAPLVASWSCCCNASMWPRSTLTSTITSPSV